MKINFSRFKKTSADKDFSFFSDGKNEIKVAHKGLSPKYRAEIDKLPIHAAHGTMIGGDEEEPEVVEPPKEENKFGNYDKFDSIANDNTKPAYDSYAPAQDKAPASMEAPIIAEEESVPTQGLAPQAPEPQVQAPGSDALGIASSGLQQQQQGLNQEAAAMEAAGKEKARIAQEQQAFIQDGLKKYEEDFQKLSAETQAVIEDIKTKKIDPNRYMENRTSGEKVMSAIGLILSGFGAGLAGQENMAMKFLNQQIDRDIAAQEKEMGKSETLLSANFKQLGDMRAAMEFTRAQQQSIYAAKLEEQAGLSAGPMAKARALQEAGKLRVSAADTIQKIAAKQAASKALNAPASTEASYRNKLAALQAHDPKLAQDFQEKYIPGVGVASIKPSDADRQALVAAKEINRGLTALQARAAKLGTTFPGSEADKVNQSMIASLQLQMKTLFQLGQISQSDMDMMNKLVADPGGFSSKKAIAQLEATKKSMSGLENNTVKKLGIVPFQQDQKYKDGDTASNAKGEKIIYKNGKWVKQ